MLTELRFQNEQVAREHLESLRWPDGPICPHCGGLERNSKLNGKAHRPGLYFCGDCREQFTVTVGTVFERSKIPLHKWVLATHLLCSSKKGMSSHQLHRILGVTYKTAWFMTHRIREAMKSKPDGLLGGGGKIVEVDETYFGNKDGVKMPRKGGSRRPGPRLTDKRAIVTLIERSGEARSFHVPRVNHENLKTVLFGQIARDSHIMTDEATKYWNIGKIFEQHSSVNHSRKGYARGPVTTNTVEGYFSVLKRGLIGTYHHIG